MSLYAFESSVGKLWRPHFHNFFSSFDNALLIFDVFTGAMPPKSSKPRHNPGRPRKSPATENTVANDGKNREVMVGGKLSVSVANL